MQIVKETETKIISLVDDHEITRQALAVRIRKVLMGGATVL